MAGDINAMAEALRLKGWGVSDLATYWGVSRQYIYSLMKQTQNSTLIECALRGLPKLTPELQLALQLQRRERSPRKTRRKPPKIGYHSGDGVTCIEPYECANENTEGWILNVSGTKKNPVLLIGFGKQSWSMSLAEFERHFVANGRYNPKCHQ